MPREQERLRKDEDVLCSTAAWWRVEHERTHTHTLTHSINHSRDINTHLLRAVAPPPQCVQELKKQLHINFSVSPSEVRGMGGWLYWSVRDWIGQSGRFQRAGVKSYNRNTFVTGYLQGAGSCFFGSMFAQLYSAPL